MNPFQSFDLSSRVWVYQCNRVLLPAEVDAIRAKATNFTDEWTAHQQQLKAAFDLRHDLFLIFCVDERSAAASGCSIDKSLHLVQQLEREHNINLLNRMMAAYSVGDEVVPFNTRDLNKLHSEGVILNDTLVFNNLVTTLAELNTQWHVPLKQSWMTQLLKAPVATR